ncbi:bifunctional diguanylate cyclase/phosphodiesterase [Sulfurospirillum arcachonense]|uniref:bifunctional diguanylate cyclase/phosphodiesterase n=1 Tax=Sulfurospirillum arcachonense TaxID=57666 RepID=UPI000468B830|nr:GGDEF domain-containing phosphodiesterase [Sulfurospirillum arcachonense]
MNKYIDLIINSKKNLKLFFTISFFFFSLFISIIIFILGYANSNKYIKEEIYKEAQVETQNKISNLKYNIEKYKQLLLSLSSSNITHNYLQKDNQDNTTQLFNLFSSAITADSNIMQLRYIDSKGDEKLRLQRDNKKENFYKVKVLNLQNKSKRYYFKETIKRANKKIWVSDIDLNIENNEIEIPYNPTIRLATPLYTNKSLQGIIIVNIFMKDILETLKSSTLFNIYLVDKDGFPLIGSFRDKGKVVDVSWSKQLNKNITLQNIVSEKADDILSSIEFNKEDIFSKNITKNLDLRQELFLLLQINQTKQEELKSNITGYLLIISIIILVSGTLFGLFLSFLPSRLVEALFKKEKELNEEQFIFNEFNKAAEVNNIISKSDLKGRITYVNDNFCIVSGYTKEEVIGKPHSLLRSPDSSKETFKELWSTIQSKNIWTGILKNRKKNGKFYYVDIAITPILDLNGKIVEYIAIRHEITEIIKQQKKLERLATKDTLTPFFNRTKLQLDINQNSKNNLAVIDIDHFSSINDFYGHNIGDVIIEQFGELINSSITDEFTLYRLHADKFAVLNTTLSQEKFSSFIQVLNQKMINSTIDLNIFNYDMITTAGVSFENNMELILTAEIANKHAKKINKSFLIYSKEYDIEKQFKDNFTWIQKIKSAITEERIVVQYQPLYNNKTKKIEKYEALVRIQDEDGNLIAPSFFLENAKKSKQYITITKIVIDQSFEKFKNNQLEFSINLTLEDIQSEDLMNYLIAKLQSYDIGKRVVLELVESEEIEDFSLLEKHINHLKLLGCKIAIDDFGTGYSNFEYLIKIKADYVKIDGSLIKDIATNNNTKEIVETIIVFSKKMNLKTIAEYVSSEDILDAVDQLEIDYSQGFYIGKPEFELVVEENN